MRLSEKTGSGRAALPYPLFWPGFIFGKKEHLACGQVGEKDAAFFLGKLHAQRSGGFVPQDLPCEKTDAQKPIGCADECADPVRAYLQRSWQPGQT